MSSLRESCGKLFDRSVTEISDTELLEVVLRPQDVAFDPSRRLLEHFGSLAELSRATASEIYRVHGIGVTEAASVAAAFELGRRVVGKRLENGVTFRTSTEIFDHFRGRLSTLRKEVFCVLLLDAKHRKLREVQVSEGSLTSSIVHPREVFAPAVRESAAALILVHNHPSSDPAPSPEDVEITRRLREAGELMGIRVLDHVIVGADTHFSFVDAGYW